MQVIEIKMKKLNNTKSETYNSPAKAFSQASPTTIQRNNRCALKTL